MTIDNTQTIFRVVPALCVYPGDHSHEPVLQQIFCTNDITPVRGGRLCDFPIGSWEYLTEFFLGKNLSEFSSYLHDVVTEFEVEIRPMSTYAILYSAYQQTEDGEITGQERSPSPQFSPGPSEDAIVEVFG